VIGMARFSRGNNGQVAVLVALLLVPLIAITGFVIDVGYAYYAQRSLQSQADAAALAGAQKLPDSSGSVSLARQYGSGTTAKNHSKDLGLVVEEVVTRCLSSVPGCDPVNAVVVDETAKVKTLFTRVLGIRSFTVHVRSTACSPCGTRPLDIMLVLDRTGSMCQDHNGNPQSGCPDLQHARDGMKTFLGLLNPEADWVGLAVLPPATSVSNKCTQPQTTNYNSTSAAYTLVPLSKDYSKDGRLVTTSNLVSTINCQQANGETSYATAIEKAQAELDLHGRPNVRKVIVFFSDGAANRGPSYYPTSSPYRNQPCHQGITSAGTVKGRGTIVYSIGYDLDAINGGANQCRAQSSTGPLESPAITAYRALQQIASNSQTFYNQPTPGQLNTLFAQVAADIQRGSAGLIDNNTQ
jgi:putative Flp pilus-assembly TadE/G-like protein/von Willebrand factor type A domain-containing protein